jgi:hypothetical protein
MQNDNKLTGTVDTLSILINPQIIIFCGVFGTRTSEVPVHVQIYAIYNMMVISTRSFWTFNIRQ